MNLGGAFMHMNRTKRNLILAAGIINLVDCAASLVLSILLAVYPEVLAQYVDYYYYFLSISTNLIINICVFAVGLIGSILLFYSVREKGRYYRNARAIYVAGVIIVILSGGTLSWVLLLIAAFTPDVIVINDAQEMREQMREEQHEEVVRGRAYEEKKQKIEELKKLRDNGVITEEEYKERLFELL